MDYQSAAKKTTRSPIAPEKSKRLFKKELGQCHHFLWFFPSHLISAETRARLVEIQKGTKNSKGRARDRKSSIEAQWQSQAGCVEAFEMAVRSLQTGAFSKSSAVEQGLLLLASAYALPKEQAPVWRPTAKGAAESQIFAKIMKGKGNGLNPGELISQAMQMKIPDVAWPWQPWLEQVLLMEVPLVLARRFPKLILAEDWIAGIVGGLSTMIDDLLDSDGWPIAEALPVFGPLLVSWVRCVDWLGKKRVPPPTLEILQASVRQLLRLVNPEGNLMFSQTGGAGDLASVQPEALKFLCRFSSDRQDRKFARLGAGWIAGKGAEQTARKKQLKQCLKGKWPTLRSSAIRKKEMQDPTLGAGNVSEFGESGLLRASWDWQASTVGVRFDGGRFEMTVSRFVSLVQGACQPVVQLNGRTLGSAGSSDLLCEYHDEDVDYLEIQIPLDDSINLIRQILLCHREDVVLIADAVSGPSPGDWQYRCEWPLAKGVEMMAETETREIYLMSENSIHALILPVSLPEWLQGPSTGKFQISDRKLELTDRQQGLGVYVPLVFDLCPRRSRLKRTWRHLTVAESKKVVGRDIAAAYRFQLDRQQWFFYRAIAGKGNRSFLGENFNGEFLFARFARDGGVTEMIRIE